MKSRCCEIQGNTYDLFQPNTLLFKCIFTQANAVIDKYSHFLIKRKCRNMQTWNLNVKLFLFLFHWQYVDKVAETLCPLWIRRTFVTIQIHGLKKNKRDSWIFLLDIFSHKGVSGSVTWMGKSSRNPWACPTRWSPSLPGLVSLFLPLIRYLYASALQFLKVCLSFAF